jgi:Protein of unknown function (DUF3124)
MFRLPLMLTLAVLLLLPACEDGPDASGTETQFTLRPSPSVDLEAVLGQTVYVPAYSHLTHDENRVISLAINLSVRNTDPDHPITVFSVRYYDNDGKLLGEYLDRPIVIPPMASRTYVVGQKHHHGGTGANFIVEWSAKQKVSEPIIEAIMVGVSGTQGMTFRSPGRVVRTKAPGKE